MSRSHRDKDNENFRLLSVSDTSDSELKQRSPSRTEKVCSSMYEFLKVLHLIISGLHSQKMQCICNVNQSHDLNLIYSENDKFQAS